MKTTHWMVFVVFVILALAACSPQPVVPVLTVSATPALEQVSSSALAAAPTLTATIVPAETVLQTGVVDEKPQITPTAEPTATGIEPAVPTGQVEAVPSATPIAETADSSGCEDKAAYYADVTIPDGTAFKQLEDFEKIWRIRNEGTCTWEGYKLVWAGGSVFDAALANPIPLVQPGEQVDISIKMRAPNQGGLYTSLWEFENSDGKRFGVNSGGIDFIWAQISVTWYPEDSSVPGSSEIPTPAGGCMIEQNPLFISQILALINDARIQNGLSALTLDSRLSTAAQAHSEDMACKDFMDHTGSDGSNWADRVKATGYAYSYVSENIYAGDPAFGGDAQGAFDWWMNSQIHRDNILNPKITQIGIGFASSNNAQYKGRYTLDFARP